MLQLLSFPPLSNLNFVVDHERNPFQFHFFDYFGVDIIQYDHTLKLRIVLQLQFAPTVYIIKCSKEVVPPFFSNLTQVKELDRFILTPCSSQLYYMMMGRHLLNK